MSAAPRKTVDDIPILPARGFFGHTRLFQRDRVGFMRRLADHGEDVFRIRLLDRLVVVVNSPALVHEVLVAANASMEKSALMRYVLYPLIGEGLFNSRGELWRRQRRLMSPIFQPGQLARYADEMVACAARDVDTWQDGATIDLARETTRIAMSVAGKTLFGAETFSEADEIGAALSVALRWTGEQAGSFLPIAQLMLREALVRAADRLPGRAAAALSSLTDRMQWPILYLGAEGRRMREAVAVLDQQVQRMIDARRATGELGVDLLGRLLAARDDDGSRMNDKQARDEILNLFLAGHDTTALSLAWAVHLLAQSPAILSRVRAEADALGRPPRYEDLPRLPLALRVFKEALRLYPPVALYTRDVAADVEIGGYLAPKGTVFLVCPWAIHRRADLWPDPERFDPDRFAPEAEAARPRCAFLGFSAGPRICIGNHFALMEAPLVLATLLQRADFERPGDAEVVEDMGAVLRPKGGVPMRVRLRRAEDLRVAEPATG